MNKVADRLFIQGIENHTIDHGSKLIPESVTMEEDITYGETMERELQLDLYYRERKPAKLRPAILFVHGGGFHAGSKQVFAVSAAYFALKYDFVCASVDYRLSQEATFPAAAQDVKNAIRWLRSVAGDYRIDTSKIIVAGGSAGGHLTAYAAATGDPSDRVALAVCFNPVLDFVSIAKNGRRASNMIRNFVGKSYEEEPELYKEASPLHIVDRNACPMLLLHGSKDETIPCAQSLEMHEKMQRLGLTSELEIYDGVAHGWFNRAPHYYEVLSRMEDFLNKQLA